MYILCVLPSAYGQNANSTPPSAGTLYTYMTKMDTTYGAIENMAADYIAANPTDSKFMKRFSRWAKLWKGRYDSTGSMRGGMQKLSEYLNTVQPICDIGGNWTNQGIDKVKGGAQWIGIVNAVYSPPSTQMNTIYAGSNTGGLWKCTNATSSNPTWTCITDFLHLPGLGIQSITGDPNNPDVIYIATAINSGIESGAYYGIGVLRYDAGAASGQEWQETALTNLTNVSMNATKIMFASSSVTEEVLYVLTDTRLERLVFDKTNMSSTSTTLYLSTFPWGVWLSDVEVLPSNPNILFISNKDGEALRGAVLKLDITNIATPIVTDITPTLTLFGGTTLNGQMQRIELAVSADKPNSVYLYAFLPLTPSNKRVLCYYDEPLNSWTFINDNIIPSTTPIAPFSLEGVGGNYFRLSLEINAVNANIIYLEGDQLAKSTDGGLTFKYSTTYNGGSPFTHADIRDLQIYESSAYGLTDKLIIGNDGGISLSTVGGEYNSGTGQGWISINGDNLSISQSYDMTLGQEGQLFTGLQDNGTAQYKDGEWAHIGEGDGGSCVVDWSNPNNVFIRVNGAIQKSISGGTNFSNWDIGLGALVGYPNTIMEQDPINADYAYGFTENGSFFFKFDTHGSGSSHNVYTKDMKTVVNFFHAIRAFAVAPSDNNTIYMGAAGLYDINGPHDHLLLKSTDNGITWTKLGLGACWIPAGQTTPTIYSPLIWNQPSTLVVNPYNANEVWVGFAGYNPSGFDRVYHSSDGGNTWKDISTGLPPVPVNDLVYRQGTISELYAATDVGVFVYDYVSDSWSCFNQDLPTSMIFDLEIDNCKGEIWAATYGRGIWKSPLATPSPYVLTGNAEWNTPMSLANDLIISSGVSLKLTNTLYMAQSHTITIEPGAKLIIDGGKITNLCGDMWEGIILQGDAQQHQYAYTNLPVPMYYQGLLEIKNNGVIENAHEAVRVYDPNIAGMEGGIIKADHAIFRNNRRAIAFTNYHNYNPNVPTQQRRNESYFKDCTFETTRELNEGLPFKVFMTAWQVEGIKVEGCTFQNTNPDATTNGNFGDGIYFIDASFNIVKEDIMQTPCSFQKLAHGVFGQEGGAGKTYVVNGCEFHDCLTGIRNEGMNFVTLVNNEFELGGNAYSTWNTGILLNGKQMGFQVEGNHFYKTEILQTDYTIGTLTVDIGSFENQIYRNKFEELAFANLSNGNNQGSGGLKGLRYLCDEHSNDFLYSSGAYDVAVTTAANGNGGIRTSQEGLVQAGDPAGNLFTQLNLDPNNLTTPWQWDYFNICNNTLKYYYGNGSAKEEPIHVDNISLYFSNFSPSCPSKVVGKIPHLTLSELQTLSVSFATDKQAYNTYKAMYETLLDGGNTDSLANVVSSAYSAQTQALRTALLGESPYLSTEVLQEAAENETVLPNTILFEILLANPDGLNNESLLHYLANERSNPFPAWMISLLRQARENVTPRTLLEMAMAHHHGNYEATAAQILRHIVLDSTGFNRTDYRGWLANLESLNADYLLIEDFLQTGENTVASDLLADIPDAYKLSENEWDEYNTFSDWVNFRLANANLGALGNEAKSNLQAIAENGKGIGAERAKNILRFYYNYAYNVTAILPNPNTQNRYAKNSETNAFQFVELFPNPAKDYLTVQYHLPTTNAKFILLDVAGKVLYQENLSNSEGQSTIDVHDYSSGMYFFQIVTGDKILQSGKFVIQK